MKVKAFMFGLQSHNDQTPIPPPVHIPTTNIPGIPPLHTLPLSPWQTIFPILSLYFWALWLATQTLRGHHVWSIIYFRHASPIPTDSSNHHFLSDPFSIPSALENGF